MPEPVDVLVAVPARNEAARIEACLSSVLAAVRLGQTHGAVRRATVAVAAHRCCDDTADRARRALAVPEVAALVWEYDDPAPVGAVRSALIRRANAEPAERCPEPVERCPEPVERCPEPVEGPAGHDWLFSTDADTVVPESWLTSGLRLAAESRSSMVVGLVDLDEGEVTAGVRLAHDRPIRAGTFADGSHDHVYAANLAIRLAAYRELGGFAAVQHGEERALLRAARAAGHAVLTTTQWRTRTSARTHARAVGGLGDLLGRLALDAG